MQSVLSLALIFGAIAGWLWTVYAFGASVWAALGWATAALLAVFSTPRRWLRIVAFNVALLIAVAGSFSPSYEGHDRGCQDFRNPIWVDDPQVAYRNAPGIEESDRRVCDGETIYHAVYHTNAHGLRVSPPEDESDDEDCVLFFGGSFTFGTGVADDETVPYQVGRMTNGRYRIRNFGVGGYGTHHVLATVQGERWLDALDCAPQVAIYQAIPSHAQRAIESWHVESGMPGPKYVLDEGGALRRDGNLRNLRETGVGNRLLSRWGPARRMLEEKDREMTPEVADLFVAMTGEWAATLRRHFPGIEAHVLYWERMSNVEVPWERLADVRVHPITKILPAADDWDATYHIPGDGHPNPTAHRLIAEYVTHRILGVPEALDESGS